MGSEGQSCPHGDSFLAELGTVAVSPPFCELLELETWGTAVEAEVQLSGGAGEQRRERMRGGGGVFLWGCCSVLLSLLAGEVLQAMAQTF